MLFMINSTNRKIISFLLDEIGLEESSIELGLKLSIKKIYNDKLCHSCNTVKNYSLYRKINLTTYKGRKL